MKIKYSIDNKLRHDAFRDDKTMHTDEMRELIDLLNSHYNNLNVTIRFSNFNVGYAQYGNYRITVCKYTKEHIIIHEYAHILSFYRYGIEGRGHGIYFYNTLKELINLYYNDINKYPWICDYISLYNRYMKEYCDTIPEKLPLNPNSLWMLHILPMMT